ncbi:eukaryotic translation initiation factor 4B [Culicoides brevitarsis]|uniref:eukaryotic translation initiation factor 4B n=1 Tax=Culicoides brevitarsis TaxID=469753 RepID=UPI00307B1612
MSTGKKGKKSKGKKISLQEFVQVPGGTGVTQVQVPTKLSWADECDEDDDIQSTSTKIIELPTAPRAARLLNDDCVPANPPFLVYLSNLPYDVEDEDIEEFFRNFIVVTIRLPRDDDGTKSRGYGYVEFETREELIDALSMPDPTIRGRRIKIDLTSENDGRRGGRNNRYGDNYGSSDRNNTNWRDRQDGGFAGGRDQVDGGRRRNDYGNRRGNDREPVVVEAGEEGSWRMGDRPKYSPPRERKQYDRPPRDDRDNNFRDNNRDRFGGRRRNDYNDRGGGAQEEEVQAERPKLNLKPRTLPMPELTFPKEEQIPTAFKNTKQNGDAEHGDDVQQNGDHEEEPVVEEKPKPRGAPSAAVFGDAKPVDTAAKEREVEEKLAQRRLELKQKAEEERKRLAESKENEGNKEEGDENGHDEETNSEQQPKSAEPVKSWRTKDDDNRPRNKNYSPERDNRGGPPRRHDGKLRDRNYNRDNRDNRDHRPNNDRYGNNRNNRNYNQKDGRGGYRGGDRDRGHGGPPPRHQDRERREYNRDPRDIEERMPKLKPSEGANFSVSNTFAGLVVDDLEE